MTLNGQGQSWMTNIKQEQLRQFLDGWWLNLAGNALRKNSHWCHKKLIVIDCTAGSGYNDKANCPGSPLIFLDHLNNTGLPYHCHFIEKNKKSFIALSNRLKSYSYYTLYNEDNSTMLVQLIDNLPKNAFGLLYMDFNGVPNFQLLSNAAESTKAQRIDFLVRYNVTSHFRSRRYNPDYIEDIVNNQIKKTYWIVKDLTPSDKNLWTFLCGYNYNYSGWSKQGWHKINSQKGRNVFERINLSKRELKKKLQPPLTGLMQNTYVTPHIELSDNKPLTGLMGYVKSVILAKLQKYIT